MSATKMRGQLVEALYKHPWCPKAGHRRKRVCSIPFKEANHRIQVAAPGTSRTTLWPEYSNGQQNDRAQGNNQTSATPSG